MFPLAIHTYFELLAFLAAIIFNRSLRMAGFRWLPVFLGFIVSIELSGRYIRTVLHQPNAWLYNISVPVEFLFYQFLFWHHFRKSLYRKITASHIAVLLVFFAVNISFVQGFERFNTHTLKLGNVSMLILCFLYFIEVMNIDREQSLAFEPMFWIATGVFLFNAGEFLYTLFSDFLIAHKLDTARRIFSAINHKLSWVLYTCLTLSILCTRRMSRKA